MARQMPDASDAVNGSIHNEIDFGNGIARMISRTPMVHRRSS
jgi:hypothetical protein